MKVSWLIKTKRESITNQSPAEKNRLGFKLMGKSVVEKGDVILLFSDISKFNAKLSGGMVERVQIMATKLPAIEAIFQQTETLTVDSWCKYANLFPELCTAFGLLNMFFLADIKTMHNQLHTPMVFGQSFHTTWSIHGLTDVNGDRSFLPEVISTAMLALKQERLASVEGLFEFDTVKDHLAELKTKIDEGIPLYELISQLDERNDSDVVCLFSLVYRYCVELPEWIVPPQICPFIIQVMSDSQSNAPEKLEKLHPIVMDIPIPQRCLLLCLVSLLNYLHKDSLEEGAVLFGNSLFKRTNEFTGEQTVQLVDFFTLLVQHATKIFPSSPRYSNPIHNQIQ